jgi:hypothetical protein
MTRPNTSQNPSRVTARLTAKLDKRLFAYAAAASAAGVSLMAATPSAEAKIVYTAANITIPANGSVKLDINKDGVADFSLYFYAYGPRKAPLGYHEEALVIDPLKTGNEVWSITSSKGDACAAALPAAAKVGAGAAFTPNELLLFQSAGTAYSIPDPRCPFGNLPRGAFLGLKFLINGETHYGWAHVALTVDLEKAVISGYAYETVPNQSINTGKTSGPSSVSQSEMIPLTSPQPATPGLLARGAESASIWRRPEDEQV